MKRIILFLVAVVTICSLRGQSLLQDFIFDRDLGGLEIAYVAETNGRTDFCVYNSRGSDGYVIVTSDDIADGGLVLGYSESGHFDPEEMPANVRWLFSKYQEQISDLRLRTSEAGAIDYVKSSYVVVPPLLGDNKWHQEYPFNQQAPELPNAKRIPTRCLAGCAAVSTSQIMYYYKWPLNPTGSVSYNWQSKRLSADFSTSSYDWSRIHDTYANGSRSMQDSTEVSRLLLECGIALKSDWGLSEGYGTSAAVDDIPKVLMNNFRYRTVKTMLRDECNDWDEIVRNELLNNRPVIYIGADEEGNGHAFVCDGADSDNYFHFNFGWGGSYDGYYLSSLPGTYPKRQMIVYNIIPNRSKLVSDAISYNLLNAVEVELSYPDSGERYSGNVNIPSKVCDEYVVTAIGSMAFANSAIEKVVIPSTVSKIASNAFFSCNDLDTIVVGWQTPLECAGTIFDDRIFSETVLVVPDGTESEYSSSFPWSLFTHITGIEESSGWSQWVPAGETGEGVYKYGWNVLGFDESSLAIYRRNSLVDPDMEQYKVNNWFDTSVLLINVEKSTGKCHVPLQHTGIFQNGDEIMVSDVPTFAPWVQYSQYPSSFDRTTGSFTLYMIYSSYSYPDSYYRNCVDSLQLSVIPLSIGKTSEQKNSGKLYDMSGRQTYSPKRGVYISEGRKYLNE